MAELTKAERSAEVEDQPRDAYGRWQGSAGKAAGARKDVIAAGDEGGLWKRPADRMKLMSRQMKLQQFASNPIPKGKGGFGVSDSFQAEMDKEWDSHETLNEAAKNIDDGSGFMGFGGDKKKQAAAKKFMESKKRFDAAYAQFGENNIGY